MSTQREEEKKQEVGAKVVQESASLLVMMANVGKAALYSVSHAFFPNPDRRVAPAATNLNNSQKNDSTSRTNSNVS